jgi:hypothetical protein
MPRVETALVLLLAMPATTFANIDATHGATAAGSDHRQPPDRSQAERNARELLEFEQLIAELHDALEDRMTSRYRAANTTLLAAMTREIDQARVKSDQAAHAERMLRQALRNGRMVAMSGDGNDWLVVFGDGYDGDRTGAIARHEEMKRIGTLAGSLHNEIERGERNAMQRNVTLASEFVTLMRSDVAISRK